jgi:hypothetical protein
LGKSTPRAPDPYKVSDAEAKASKETAAWNQSLNMVDQSSPFGSVSYSSNGVDPATGAPKYSQSTTLSPELQQLLNSQVGAQTGLSSAITGSLGNLPTSPFDPSDINTDKIRDASYSMRVAQMEPQWDKAWKDLEGRLSDRGLPMGSEISNDQYGEFNDARNNSLSQISRQAELDASNDYQRQFGNALTIHNQPLQQLQGLMGMSSPVSNPSFNSYPTASAQAPDVGQNVWNAYNADVQRSQNQQSGLMGGLLGLGKLGVSAYSAGMFSDRRLKRDIKRIGAMPSGLPVYQFRYVWGDDIQTGVMAQEAIELFPEAVSMDASGFWKVRYDLIG